MFTKDDVGCYVDESCGSADDCNSRTVCFAIAHGMKEPEGFSTADSEILSEMGDKAVEWLNENLVGDDVYFWFEDNSLFLMEQDSDF